MREERRGHEEQKQEQSRMHEAGHRGACAGADVHDGTRHRAGCRNTAQQGADEIREALADQFLIGIVPLVHHAIGDDGAQEGLHGDEHGDGEGGLDQLREHFEANVWEVELGQTPAHAAKLRANRGDVKPAGQPERTDGGGGQEEACHGTWEIPRKLFGPEAHDPQRRHREDQRGWMDRHPVGRQQTDLPEEIHRHFSMFSPKKFLIWELRMRTAMPLVKARLTG
jgi:hypothetical protein